MFIKLNNISLSMPTPNYTGMDRATWNYLFSRQSEKWYGFITKTKEAEQNKKIQHGLNKILKAHNENSALNGATLEHMTDRAYPEIIYCAGTYNKETREDIKAYLRSQGISFKSVKGSYESFASPVWVKEALHLPPSKYVSDFLSKKLH